MVLAHVSPVPLDAKMVTKDHTAARPGEDRSHEGCLCPVLHFLDRPTRLSSSRENFGELIVAIGPCISIRICLSNVIVNQMQWHTICYGWRVGFVGASVNM